MNLEDELVEIENNFSLLPEDGDDFDQELCRLHEMSRDEYQEFLERRSQTEFGKVWSRYRNIMLQLADEYLTCSDDHRKEIRQRIAGLLYCMTYVVVLGEEFFWLLRIEQDLLTLRRIVAMVSIADDSDDPTNQSLLSNVYHQAKKTPLDVEQVLTEISSISSDVPPKGKAVSTREYLGSFQPWTRS